MLNSLQLLVTVICILTVSSNSYSFPNRLSPQFNEIEASCRVNLCSGAGARVPTSPNISYYAEYTVPPVPTVIGNCYYIYYNIIFSSDSPYGTNNQFVPQLMLGTALSDSTGSPYYNPIWKHLTSWHIGSQYFFFIQNESSSSGHSGKAVTGKLIDVYEGDIVYTSFSLSENGEIWTLTMGVKGNDSAVSIVKATQPFMGLENHTKSWTEDKYNETRLGCCWELYNIQSEQMYPKYMNYTINTTSNVDESEYWKPWRMGEIPNCSYSPTWSLTSNVNQAQTQQLAYFDIFYNSTK
eukprot:441071_1